MVAVQKVVLITGSSRRRVGFHLAKYLIDHGFNVVLHGCESVASGEQLAAELGEKACFYIADVTSEEEVERLVEQIVSRFGRIDALVTLASLWKATPLQELKADELSKQFAVNALGSILCAQRVGMQMVKQASGGSIVTVGDWAVDRPYPGYLAYFLSKGGIETATKALAVEFATLNPRIRVNCIHPGNILFPDDLPENIRQSIESVTPTHHVNDPLAFCQAVHFFLENSMATGTSIKLDSGRSLSQ